MFALRFVTSSFAPARKPGAVGLRSVPLTDRMPEPVPCKGETSLLCKLPLNALVALNRLLIS